MVRKQELAKAMAEKFGLEKRAAREYVDYVFDEMERALASGQDFMAYGFFVMGTKICMARDLKVNPLHIRGAETLPNKNATYRKAFVRFSTRFKALIKSKKVS